LRRAIAEIRAPRGHDAPKPSTTLRQRLASANFTLGKRPSPRPRRANHCGAPESRRSSDAAREGGYAEAIIGVDILG
jgi:hypothetical protein